MCLILDIFHRSSVLLSPLSNLNDGTSMMEKKSESWIERRSRDYYHVTPRVHKSPSKSIIWSIRPHCLESFGMLRKYRSIIIWWIEENGLASTWWCFPLVNYKRRLQHFAFFFSSQLSTVFMLYARVYAPKWKWNKLSWITNKSTQAMTTSKRLRDDIIITSNSFHVHVKELAIVDFQSKKRCNNIVAVKLKLNENEY